MAGTMTRAASPISSPNASRTLTIRRRVERPTPYHKLRIGAAARSGAAATVAFPGIVIAEPNRDRRRGLAGALAFLAHAAVIGGLFTLAWMIPAAEKEKPIPIELVHLPPPPPPPVAKVEPPPPPKAEPVPIPRPAPPAPAPAPKALAERRSVNFNPSAQTITPQIVNPSVIAKATPTIDAKSLDVKSLQSSAAPRDIQHSTVSVEAVQAVTNVAAPSAPTQVDVGSASAPALRGPIQAAGTTPGASVGPKAIAAPSGASVGAGKVVVSGDGSSVREGAISNRDVLGSPDGARVASADTRVGQGNLSGKGEGTTLGGDTSDCDARPEVKAYMAQIKERTLSRWSPPPDAPLGSTQATLNLQLDVGGSATRVKLVSSKDPKVGASVVDALRSASPFPPMPDRVRCLSERGVTAIFSLQITGSSSTIAN